MSQKKGFTVVFYFLFDYDGVTEIVDGSSVCVEFLCGVAKDDDKREKVLVVFALQI